MLTMHTSTCEGCGRAFAYDAPVDQEIAPVYCSTGCAEERLEA